MTWKSLRAAAPGKSVIYAYYFLEYISIRIEGTSLIEGIVDILSDLKMLRPLNISKGSQKQVLI